MLCGAASNNKERAGTSRDEQGRAGTSTLGDGWKPSLQVLVAACSGGRRMGRGARGEERGRPSTSRQNRCGCGRGVGGRGHCTQHDMAGSGETALR